MKRKVPRRFQHSPSTSQDNVVELFTPSQLTSTEQQQRHQLEQQVESAFYLAGMALQQLRDLRLYRSTHRSFQEYCQERFEYTRRRSYQLIDAARVVDNLRSQSEQIVHIFPTKEAQVRPLSALPPSQQVEAWQQAVSHGGGKVPTASMVKKVVQQFQEPLPNPHFPQEVCVIKAKDNPDLQGKSGCWCIVSQVDKHSCQICTWDGEYVVSPAYLESTHYSELECQQMEELGVRMSALYQTGKLESTAYRLLETLGKVSRPHLTPLEEQLLELLESEYLSELEGT